MIDINKDFNLAFNLKIENFICWRLTFWPFLNGWNVGIE
jgi:hypothetical protein